MTKEPLVVCDILPDLPHIKNTHSTGSYEARSCVNPRPVEASAPAAPPHEYKHYLWCNGDRTVPAGEPGHCCSCFNDINTRAALLSAAPPTDAAPKDQTQVADEMLLRREVWLRHGHIGLYGDDGEMQCGTCGIDFKRLPVPRLVELLGTQGLEKSGQTQAAIEEAVRVVEEHRYSKMVSSRAIIDAILPILRSEK